MTPESFKAWLDGYMEGNPEPDPERIREKAQEIEVSPQPDPVWVPRPLSPWYPQGQWWWTTQTNVGDQPESNSGTVQVPPFGLTTTF